MATPVARRVRVGSSISQQLAMSPGDADVLPDHSIRSRAIDKMSLNLSRGRAGNEQAVTRQRFADWHRNTRATVQDQQIGDLTSTLEDRSAAQYIPADTAIADSAWAKYGKASLKGLAVAGLAFTIAQATKKAVQVLDKTFSARDQAQEAIAEEIQDDPVAASLSNTMTYSHADIVPTSESASTVSSRSSVGSPPV
jgi:hypothetical protein